MSKIYITNAVFSFNEHKNFLHPIRQLELEAIKNKKVQDEKTTSSLLLDFALSKTDKSIPLPAELSKEINGKPHLKNGGINFSLSHSHGICACAISQTNIGLDIERDRELKSFASAKKIFDNDAFNEFERLTDKKSQAFLKQWTNVESRLKLTGEGISGLFNNVTKNINDFYSFYFYYLDTHITCTIAKNIAPEIVTVGSEDLYDFLKCITH